MTLEETLKCAFTGIGAQVGEQVRCLVESELASHFNRIKELQALLTVGACNPSTDLTSEEAPPAA